MLDRIVKRSEKIVISSLMIMMLLIVLLSIFELAWILLKDVLSPPLLILEINELLEIFGMFLLVLIGIELLETLQVYSQSREFRAEVIILVAIIALSRKIITLDFKETSALTILALSAMMFSLMIGYYAIKKINSEKRE